MYIVGADSAFDHYLEKMRYSILNAIHYYYYY